MDEVIDIQAARDSGDSTEGENRRHAIHDALCALSGIEAVTFLLSEHLDGGARETALDVDAVLSLIQQTAADGRAALDRIA